MLIRIMTAAAVTLVMLVPGETSAHGGGLDRYGCHNDRQRGGYHCHRGTPAPPPRARAARPVPVYTPPRPVQPAPPQPVIAAPRMVQPAPPAQLAAANASPLPPIRGLPLVIDGDTVMIGGQSIRLHGIDAFEADQTCNRGAVSYDCGVEARRQLEQIIGNATLFCAPRTRDDFGRTVAVCRVGATDIGAELVRRGWAMAFMRYSLDYQPDEAEARINRIGAWDGAFAAPWLWRAGNRTQVTGEVASAPQPAAQPMAAIGQPNDCQIRGNINRQGEHIYHLPEDPYYQRVRAERMFCTTADAEAAGFRRAGRPRQ